MRAVMYSELYAFNALNCVPGVSLSVFLKLDGAKVIGK